MMGLTHCALMAFASFDSLGLIPRLSLLAAEWAQLYSAYSFFLVIGSLAVVLRQMMKTEVFLPEALLDFIIGAVIFKTILFVVPRILLRTNVTPWISLLPGLYLSYYGWTLMKGRQIWKGFQLPG